MAVFAASLICFAKPPNNVDVFFFTQSNPSAASLTAGSTTCFLTGSTTCFLTGFTTCFLTALAAGATAFCTAFTAPCHNCTEYLRS